MINSLFSADTFAMFFTVKFTQMSLCKSLRLYITPLQLSYCDVIIWYCKFLIFKTNISFSFEIFHGVVEFLNIRHVGPVDESVKTLSKLNPLMFISFQMFDLSFRNVC